MTPSRYFLLIDTLARFTLKADARRYFFGYLWWVLEPLIYVLVFYLVFQQLLGTRQPDFLAFLVVGKLTFIWFSKSVNQAANSLLLARGLIAQRDMPKVIFPLAVLHEGFYKQLPVFGLMLVYVMVSGYGAHSGWLWLLPLVVTQYLVIVVCSLIGSLLVCLQRDFVIMINLGMVLMLFISGIFWDVNAIQDPVKVHWLMTLNPLAFLIDGYRSVLMYGSAPDAVHLLALGLGALVAAMFVAALYQRMNFWIARRVISQ